MSDQLLFCLDAGHGLPDPGAIGRRGCREMDFALDIVYQAKAGIEEQGHKAILTREGENGLDPLKAKDLVARAAIANAAGCASFTAFHLNATDAKNPDGSDVDGLEVYCFARGGEGERLATEILNELLPVMNIRNRGVKAAGFVVLKKTKMRAALVETGFITNPDQEIKMTDPEYRRQIGRSIAKAIIQNAGGYWEVKTAAAAAPVVIAPPAPAVPAQPGQLARVVTLQTVLNILRFRDSEGNTLKEDGKIGPKTRSAASKVLLEKGCDERLEALITWAQKRLLDLGFALPIYGADGDFGDETADAVKAFQNSRGLSPDGEIGPKTWGALLTY